ncbi:group I truncated hemoglobin [Flindersiella endophytica]
MRSIFDQIGGPDAVALAVDDFYARVLADPSLTGYFDDAQLDKLKTHQRAFFATALGGPQEYRGRSMDEAHAGLDITPAAFDSVVGHLVATLQSLSVPDEIIGQIGAALLPLKEEIVSTAA